jgi:hypothetical protein
MWSLRVVGHTACRLVCSLSVWFCTCTHVCTQRDFATLNGDFEAVTAALEQREREFEEEKTKLTQVCFGVACLSVLAELL